jgi:glycosyltransferase involved in cell wall biosynthesis
LRRAKIVHDNLNAGGGSERVAFATIELLNEMNFIVDVATMQKPDLAGVEKNFGNENSHLWKFNQIEILDIYSLLDVENLRRENKRDNNINNTSNHPINGTQIKNRFNDENYDLIINTHGDLFPYYNVIDNEYYRKNYFLEEIEKKNNSNNSHSIKITYCHYPLVPQLIKEKDYIFLEKFFDSFIEYPQKIKDMIADKVLEKYNQMMNNTFILTNSKFSKQAIEKIYGNDRFKAAAIIYPPVDIERFKKFYNSNNNNNINNSLKKDNNSILVISRLSPDKKIENAIEIGKNLKEKENIAYYHMTIVGNIVSRDMNYLEKLNNLIDKYMLKENIKIEYNVPFYELQKLLMRSNIYIHPTPAEPFGISIVEAISAGLIPTTPNVGGNTEFVPSKYQYQSIEQATEIITKIIRNKNKNSWDDYERKELSDSISKFSKEKFKEGLRETMEILLENKQKAMEITIKKH